MVCDLFCSKGFGVQQCDVVGRGDHLVKDVPTAERHRAGQLDV